MSKVQTLDVLGREKVSDSKCNLVKIENLYRNLFIQAPEAGAEPFQDSFVPQQDQVQALQFP